MYGSKGVPRYRETDLGTTTREKLIVLLYEKMIADLEEAVAAAANDDRLLFTQRINHSQRIVAELRGALDHAVGGEIAGNLDAIYDFLFREHLALLVDRDPGRARACIEVLRPLLEAWKQVPGMAAEAVAPTSNRQPEPGLEAAGGREAQAAVKQHQTLAGAADAAGGRTGSFSVSA